MTVVNLELAESVLAALRLSREQFRPALRLAAAMHWYSRGKLFQEMAAMVAGVGRARFLKELSRAEVDAFVVDFDDWRRELELG